MPRRSQTPPSSRRPWLLASVIDPEEAAVALRSGADVIDVKEPRRGSLGACSLPVLRAVVALRAAAGRAVPVSAALGDAPDPRTTPARAAEAAACGADFVKVGLLGVLGAAEAIALLRPIVDAARRASATVRVVPAAFAEDGCSLPPAALPLVAAAAGAAGCLIDTASKDGRTLFDHLAPKSLSRIVAECRRRGLLCALSGSLQAEDGPRLRALAPDFVGARGALCPAGREARLEARRLTGFRDALRRA